MFKISSCLLILLSLSLGNHAQSKAVSLEKLWNTFANDTQLQYGQAGICVMEATTGKVIFDKNANTGFAPASTQKILTAIAAYEGLGSSFKYQTTLGYTGTVSNKKLQGNIVIGASGDPTFGSWRYLITKENVVLKKIGDAVQAAGIESVTGNIIAIDKGFDINPTPDNWMWGDMGNYYGAGHWALNWRENQYDLYFKSGQTIGSATAVAAVDPDESIVGKRIVNEVTTGTANTGDESSIFTAPFSPIKLVQGSISSNQNNFKVSGSFSLADMNCLTAIQSFLQKNGCSITGSLIPPSAKILGSEKQEPIGAITPLLTLNSPSLDSIVYWFLKKSINLYGEALVRTIGLQKKGYGSTNKGLEWIDSFYTANGFDTKAMHMTDGSGLSPTNRITPYTLVKALQFAQTKPWFTGFYDALPRFNGMKLKSGTIHRTKCFTGYHNGYIVSLMVNNYNGGASMLVDKMYQVLDGLK